MGAKKAREAGYLCGECAADHGGVWPEGHAATFHPDTCPLCENHAWVASWDDWNWPDSRLQKVAAQTRET